MELDNFGFLKKRFFSLLSYKHVMYVRMKEYFLNEFHLQGIDKEKNQVWRKFTSETNVFLDY